MKDIYAVLMGIREEHMRMGTALETMHALVQNIRDGRADPAKLDWEAIQIGLSVALSENKEKP